MTNELFSVIILHYNQPKYILKAIDSVLSQKYKNIELIITDDASTEIDVEKIKKYISDHKGENIQNVSYVLNSENIGTVRTVNKAVKSCQGKYILFFAADDLLFDENVVSNYAKAFKKSEENVFMISSQCHMMDIKMKKELQIFVDKEEALDFNQMTAREQYKLFCEKCFLAMGATSMKAEMFEKYGYFSEEYKFVEDWSYFLHLTRNGGLIKYSDFDGLLHRDGGISHTVYKKNAPKHILGYMYDIVRIFEIEILPYVKQFEPEFIIQAIERYAQEKESYVRCGGDQKTFHRLKMFSLFPSFYIQSKLLPITSSWAWTAKMTRAAAWISIVYMGMLAAAAFSPFYDLFGKLSAVFAVALLVTIVLIFGSVLIKLGLTMLRYAKKFIRGVKK